jgi:hypothetical protein
MQSQSRQFSFVKAASNSSLFNQMDIDKAKEWVKYLKPYMSIEQLFPEWPDARELEKRISYNLRFKHEPVTDDIKFNCTWISDIVTAMPRNVSSEKIKEYTGTAVTHFLEYTRLLNIEKELNLCSFKTIESMVIAANFILDSRLEHCEAHRLPSLEGLLQHVLGLKPTYTAF